MISLRPSRLQSLPALRIILLAVTVLGHPLSAMAAPLHPMKGGNPQRTGVTALHGPHDSPQNSLELRPGHPGGNVGLQPILDADGNIYTGFGPTRLDASRKETLISFDPNGRERWRFSPGEPASRFGLSVPALTPDGMVVMAFRDGYFRGFHKDSGEMAWSRDSRSTGSLLSAPCVDAQGAVYISGSGASGFFKIDPAAGEVLWEHAMADGTGSCPALSNDQAIVYFSRGGNQAGLYALDAETGAVKWHFAPVAEPGFGWTSPVVGHDGTIYHADATTGHLYAIADEGGGASLKWQYDPERPGSAPRLPAVDGESVYLGTTGPDPALIALHLDGTLRWRHEFPGGSWVTNPVVTPDAVYAGIENDGRIVCYEKATGRLRWEKVVGGPECQVTPVTVGPDQRLYLGADGTLENPDQAVVVVLDPPSAER